MLDTHSEIVLRLTKVKRFCNVLTRMGREDFTLNKSSHSEKNN